MSAAYTSRCFDRSSVSYTIRMGQLESLLATVAVVLIFCEMTLGEGRYLLLLTN